MGTLAGQDHWINASTRAVLAIIGAVSLAMAGVLQKTFLSAGQIRLHTTARAASEALKAEIYRYLVKVPPYEGGDADTVLMQAQDRVDENGKEFLAAKAVVVADDKQPPSVTTIEDYTRERVVAQRDWHNNRVQTLESKAGRLRAAELAATAAAAVLAAIISLAGLFATAEIGSLSAWVGLATTVSGAIAAHLATGRYDRLATSYAHTATQLDRLVVSRQLAGNGAADASYVEAVEAILAAQNGTWTVVLNA